MILAIDMGNSNIVIGGIDDRKTYFVERITTNPSNTDLEYAVNIKGIMGIHGIPISDIDGAIISSVVPPLTSTIVSAVQKICRKTPLVVGPGMKTGLNILMDNPASVGSDLIVDAVAAIHSFPAPIIVIDMGTATTICMVDKAGSYIGGIIFPGLRVALDSLSERAAQLPYIGLSEPTGIAGKNTIDCMRNGIIYGNSAMIDGIIDRMEEEFGEKASIVSTGGLAPFVLPHCRHNIVYDEALLLKGLLILYEKNT